MKTAMTFDDYVASLRVVYKNVGLKLRLRRPADEARIEAFESHLGTKLPTELKSVWRKTNGTSEDAVIFARPDFLTGYSVLSLAEARSEWNAFAIRAPQYGEYEQDRPRGREVRPGWFEPGWIPFAGFGGGALVLMLDLSPSPSGRVGQIIAYTHDPDEIQYVSESFGSLLTTSLEVLSNDSEEILGVGN